MKREITRYGLPRYNPTFAIKRRRREDENYLAIEGTDDRDFFETREEAENEKKRLLTVFKNYKDPSEYEALKKMEIIQVKITVETTPISQLKDEN